MKKYKSIFKEDSETEGYPAIYGFFTNYGLGNELFKDFIRWIGDTSGSNGDQVDSFTHSLRIRNPQAYKIMFDAGKRMELASKMEEDGFADLGSKFGDVYESSKFRRYETGFTDSNESELPDDIANTYEIAESSKSSSYESNFRYFQTYFDKLFQQKAGNLQQEANDIADAIFSAMLDLYAKKFKDDTKAEAKASKLALFVSKRMKYLHDNNPQNEENEPLA